MEDIEGQKNLGVGVVGDLKKKELIKVEKEPKPEKITEKKLKEGTVNAGTRTTKVEYLRHRTKTVAIINAKGEYEIKPTKDCGEGDVVWVLEDDNTFTKTNIY